MNDLQSLWQPKEMTIPEVRARLFELAEELRLPELFRLAEQLKRRRNMRPAPARHKSPSKSKAQAIRDYHEAHPEVGEFEIGVIFEVNQGRVSEALHGKRGNRR